MLDAVVIGSGFGGSIAACRLAQQGRSVVVLERGRRYRPEDFPRDVTDTDALFWRHDRRRQSTGLYDVRFFSALGCLVAAGVGGGSLIYANIHIRPDAAVFDDPRWPSGTDRAGLDPYYDRVAAMLQVAPVPASVALPKRDIFYAAAAKLGREAFDPDAAVRWPEDASATGHAEPGTCQFLAECEFGCRAGAKRSADMTYLAEAERGGAQIRPGRVVAGLRRTADGFEVVHHDVTSGAEEITAARRVVLAAGTLGSTELLLRSRDRDRTLPRLSSMLGHGFSANGDFLGSIRGADTELAPDLGPDVTTVMRFFDRPPEFTLAAPTFNASVMKVLFAMGRPAAHLLRPVGPLLWRALPWLIPSIFARGLYSLPTKLPRRSGDWRRSTNLFAIGRDNADGRLQLTNRGLDVAWRYRAENADLIERTVQAMAEVAECYGGRFYPLATWSACQRVITVHPLGGCRLSTGPSTGVVSPTGEVHGYPGLFVADGSVVPAAIGFHPVMTICALAERTAEAVVASY